MNAVVSILAALIAGFGAVFMKTKTVKKRRVFASYAAFVRKFKILSCASMGELTDVMSKALTLVRTRELRFVEDCIELTRSGEEFACAWGGSLKNSGLNLSGEDESFIASFAEIVGKSDMLTQNRMLDIYIRQADEKLETIKEYENKTLVSQLAALMFIGAGAALLAL